MRFSMKRGCGGGPVAVWFVAAAAVAVMLSGCSTVRSPGSSGHASLTITGHGVSDVVLMARTVFEEQGYTLARAETDRMIFERPGTKGEALKYGGWDGEGVVMRVKLDLQEMGETKHLLRCDVFSVREAGKAAFEYETKLFLLSARFYRKLLEEIQTRLDADAAWADTRL